LFFEHYSSVELPQFPGVSVALYTAYVRCMYARPAGSGLENGFEKT